MGDANSEKTSGKGRYLGPAVFGQRDVALTDKPVFPVSLGFTVANDEKLCHP